MRIALALSLLLIAGLAAAQPGTFAGGVCDTCGVITSINTAAQEEQWQPLGVVPAPGSLSSPGGSEGRSAFAFGSDGSRGLVLIEGWRFRCLWSTCARPISTLRHIRYLQSVNSIFSGAI